MKAEVFWEGRRNEVEVEFMSSVTESEGAKLNFVSGVIAKDHELFSMQLNLKGNASLDCARGKPVL